MKTTPPTTLILVHSYHHMNTEKVAAVMANMIQADLKHPEDIDPKEIKNYDLIGFGAGIDSGKHYEPLLDLAEKLPVVDNKKAFIFSTSALVGEQKKESDHSALRTILLSKGFDILDEFHCKGYNTNSFLKYFGGMNKGRPNAQDLQHAKHFAQNLLHNIEKE